MQFTTIQFIIFFTVACFVYYVSKPTWRWVVLLIASIYFYAQLDAPHLLVALALVTIISYFLGLKLNNLPIESNKRKLVLWIGILLNLSVMAVVRYLPSIVNSFQEDLISRLKTPNLMITIGVSFFVFHAISYLIDIYYVRNPAEFHFGYFSLYLSFFPKLLQGPIERASKLIPQLRNPQTLNDEMIRSALLLFTWGLFKKVVVADRLGMMVDIVYDDLPSFTGFTLRLATLLYAIQIYCDFSGYTDMAIGIARLLGINLSINFKRPYLAVSIVDFWRRWHITFSNWIFEYIFKPIQLNLRSWKTWANPIALLATFFLSGIWHGANWTFVVWGLLHGFYMAAFVLFTPYRKKFLKRFRLENSVFIRIIQIGMTFLLVSFAWIFFRANTLADAGYVVRHIFSDLDTLPRLLIMLMQGKAILDEGLVHESIRLFNIPLQEYYLVGLGIIILLIVELPKNMSKSWLGVAFYRHTVFRWTTYLLLVLAIFGLGITGQTKFVYFQF